MRGAVSGLRGRRRRTALKGRRAVSIILSAVLAFGPLVGAAPVRAAEQEDATEVTLALDGSVEQEREDAEVTEVTDAAEAMEATEEAGTVEKLQAELYTDDTLEYLDAEHKKLFMTYSSAYRPAGCDDYLERFLAYFIYRHCTEAFDEDDFSDRISFCLFCERLFASLICTEGAKTPEEIVTLARIISEEIEYSDDNTLRLMY
jgi:hypothetical protein